MNLILIQPHELAPDHRVGLRDQRADHIRSVLHATVGQTIRLGILNGRQGLARIDTLTAEEITLTATLDRDPVPEAPLDLLLALPRPKVLKRLWAPLASLGLRRIFVTNAAKVPRHYFDTHWLAPTHYTPALIEGLEQAADTRLPEVRVIRRLKPFIEDELAALCPDGRRLLAHPTPHPSPPRGTGDTLTPTLLAIGPEGGWTDFELELLGRHGFAPVSLGPRRLRTDTACVALLTACRYG